MLALLIASHIPAEAQSGKQYRRSAVMNGNQVRSVFGNWGVIGQPVDTRPRGAWKNDNDGYLGDVSPFVGAEVRWQDTTFHSVVTTPASRPTQMPDQGPTGKQWTFEPVSGYFAGDPNPSIAMSNNKATWPDSWPDKQNDGIDPGWRGSWNGYFGKRVNADLESYFVMDDNSDERFNVSQNNSRGIAFKPDSNNSSRNGLGIEVRVRALQWAQFLAQDNIFWLYEITNTGTTDYDRVVFGMLVGTYIGVTASDDSPQEYDDDWSFYDVNENITYTGDFDRNVARNPRWVGPVGVVGYAFLESPGNPFDGIDNDGDADSSLSGVAAAPFVPGDFLGDTTRVGKPFVSIAADFSRSVFTIPNVDSLKIWTRGMRDSIWVSTNRNGRVPSRLVEGNVVTDFSGNQSINRNAYDGIDNDFDGLIDENQFLHYRQFKRNRNPPNEVLLDVLRPVRYVNYRTGAGSGTTSMIDERRNDLVDNDGDWQIDFDDVGRDGIGSTALNYPGPDFGERDGSPTSGYEVNGFDTGLPGEPNMDKTDVSESDQIGLSSFYYFTPANAVRLGDDESLWRNLAPGFFDVPLSIVNNQPERGEDGDFIYGSGYFPLLAKGTERFSLALVYGGGKGGSRSDDITDLLRNKRTVQKIYDANYQFPTPPDAPTLTAVAGDHEVTLYWDRVAENSVDPVLRTKDFEGYKVYKSTDPNFSDIFTITDANGTKRGYQPIAQYDIRDGVEGYFRASGDLYNLAAGYSYYLGNETGLQHSFVDRDVDNGRRYYYAVVAYDKGDEIAGIFPGENTFSIRFESTGEVSNKDINVVQVTPNARVAGYIPPADGVSLTHMSGSGTGSASYEIVDERALTGHRYHVEFLDTEIDTIDNNGNGLRDAADSTEWQRVTSAYSVRDLHEYTERFYSQDTLNINLQRRHLVESTVLIRDEDGDLVAPQNYVLDSERGAIKGASAGSLPPTAGGYTASYQYYPVYRSPHLQGTPYEVENNESDIFDGMRMNFQNSWSVSRIDSLSGWRGQPAYVYSFTPTNLPLLRPPIRGYRNPSDYEIHFSDTIVDTSSVWPPGAPRFPFDTPLLTYYRIYNLTEQRYVKFLLAENPVPGGDGRISPFDAISILDVNPRGEETPSWYLFFSNKEGEPNDTVYNLGIGDTLVLKTTKPFNQGDTFEFATSLPAIDNQQAASMLENVNVVPNPYVTASSFEPPLSPGITSGRGERKIDFIHLPAQSTINIFTSRGDHVITLLHDGSIDDGAVSWNLKTKENLDIAFGIYFYVVESPVGSKSGKIAIIK